MDVELPVNQNHPHHRRVRLFGAEHQNVFKKQTVDSSVERQHHECEKQIVSLLFMRIGNRKWQFFGKFSDGKTILLRMFACFHIKRHTLIAGNANPFDPIWDEYLFKRK
ncbi:hypothetical protein KJ766_03195, partial [Patescibacteria group bacterium]|nr:hypothetical protein [Patescibacteria group bacterium]